MLSGLRYAIKKVPQTLINKFVIDNFRKRYLRTSLCTHYGDAIFRRISL